MRDKTLSSQTPVIYKGKNVRANLIFEMLGMITITFGMFYFLFYVYDVTLFAFQQKPTRALSLSQALIAEAILGLILASFIIKLTWRTFQTFYRYKYTEGSELVITSDRLKVAAGVVLGEIPKSAVLENDGKYLGLSWNQIKRFLVIPAKRKPDGNSGWPHYYIELSDGAHLNIHRFPFLGQERDLVNDLQARLNIHLEVRDRI